LATDEKLNRYSVAEGEGELAITHFEVLERWRDLTRLAVRLETGRRNQIRVHLSELGHPLLGDERYGRLRALHRYWPYKRIALHAETLEIEHPLSGERLQFRAPLPSEFHRLLKRLGGSMPSE
jgi:23S rRNA pseudouridine1911/1915/1917 synthase